MADAARIAPARRAFDQGRFGVGSTLFRFAEHRPERFRQQGLPRLQHPPRGDAGQLQSRQRTFHSNCRWREFENHPRSRFAANQTAEPGNRETRRLSERLARRYNQGRTKRRALGNDRIARQLCPRLRRKIASVQFVVQPRICRRCVPLALGGDGRHLARLYQGRKSARR